MAEIKDAIRNSDKHGLTKPGQELVPIHAIRDRVDARLGPVDRQRFDRLLKTERAKGKLDLVEIADTRDTPAAHLRKGIEGIGGNSTFFFVDRPRRGRTAKQFRR